MSEDQAALKRLRRVGNSLRRRALTLSESSSHLPRVVAQDVGYDASVPSVLAIEDQGVDAQVVPIPAATLAQFRVPVVAYSLDKESTSSLLVDVVAEVPREDGLVEALAEVVGEGDEVEGAKKVAKTVVKMLEVVTETGEAIPAVGFAEVVETVDTSCAGSPSLRFVGTVVAFGSAEELGLVSSMPKVNEGEGVGDVAALEPPSILELRIFPNSLSPREMPFLEV
ncbi:hypothetical protein Nepgr_029691 [Nepenthes gracilis]|uniref:Uncharacterized protein n=1 Tax=Nepenthes gracilis TaxID=150966 RepID=A0AAD3TES0_NEPGR|nr:hypothetical protein Nepgr_029691 [Nepenthes gracilis]